MKSDTNQPPLGQHTVVHAVEEIHDGKQVIPVGATGAIIDIFAEGYTIEFVTPIHAIASVSRTAVVAA